MSQAPGHGISRAPVLVPYGVESRTLTWRALTTDNASALTRDYAAVEAVDHIGEHYSEQDVRYELEDASIDLRRDTLAALAPDGGLVAFDQ